MTELPHISGYQRKLCSQKSPLISGGTLIAGTLGSGGKFSRKLIGGLRTVSWPKKSTAGRARQWHPPSGKLRTPRRRVSAIPALCDR